MTNTGPFYKNGTNLIIVNTEKKVYVQRANYGEKKLMLPGGGIERFENARVAAVRETREESGFLVDDNLFELCALFHQRPYGVVFLYITEKYEGEMLTEPDEEISERTFMSLEEILEKKDEFFLAYIRMIIHYFTWKHIQNKQGVIEGALSQKVLVPSSLIKGLHEEEQAYYI